MLNSLVRITPRSGHADHAADAGASRMQANMLLRPPPPPLLRRLPHTHHLPSSAMAARLTASVIAHSQTAWSLPARRTLVSLGKPGVALLSPPATLLSHTNEVWMAELFPSVVRLEFHRSASQSVVHLLCYRSRLTDQATCACCTHNL